MILDASALLAYLHQEQGGLQVEQVLATAFMSTVNWCEVLQKSAQGRLTIKPCIKTL
jgi:ribonuclease VapC